MIMFKSNEGALDFLCHSRFGCLLCFSYKCQLGKLNCEAKKYSVKMQIKNQFSFRFYSQTRNIITRLKLYYTFHKSILDYIPELKKLKLNKIIYQFFSTFGPTTDSAKEEDRDGAGEQKTSGSLKRSGILGGGKNGRSRR